MLNVDNLTYTIQQRVILEKISFFCEENLTIIGTNGSGKTTLAKAIAQMIPNDSITINKESLVEKSNQQRAKLINYIPPKLEVFDEHMSVQEFLSLSILDLLQEGKTANLSSVIKDLKLEHLKNSFCCSLSSGEGQLLLFASAIMQNAQITIFDEPTTNLDPTKVKLVFDLLQKKDLFQQKIVITHDLNFAKKLGFKILRVEDGKIAFFGESKEFFSQENLQKTFHGIVKVVDSFVVECL